MRKFAPVSLTPSTYQPLRQKGRALLSVLDFECFNKKGPQTLIGLVHTRVPADFSAYYS
jgi:hypothetical protein